MLVASCERTIDFTQIQQVLQREAWHSSLNAQVARQHLHLLPARHPPEEQWLPSAHLKQVRFGLRSGACSLGKNNRARRLPSRLWKENEGMDGLTPTTSSCACSVFSLSSGLRVCAERGRCAHTKRIFIREI